MNPEDPRTAEQWRRDEGRDDAEVQDRDEKRARFAEDWHPGDGAALAAGIRAEAPEVDAGRVDPRYTCVGCGRSMRTRGVDGRCFNCIEPQPQRCEGCQRVRLEPAGEWQDHPGRLPGEIPMLCSTCWSGRRRAAEAAYGRGVRDVQRKMAKGYGPAPEGVDPFRGFHEGGE